LTENKNSRKFLDEDYENVISKACLIKFGVISLSVLTVSLCDFAGTFEGVDEQLRRDAEGSRHGGGSIF